MSARKTSAADAFTALGIAPANYTAPMLLAIKQKWSGLPTDAKVGDLRDQLAAITTADVGTVADVKAQLVLQGVAVVTDADAKSEHARLKRNAAVNAWRERGKIQAALDARELKFAALRAKRQVATVRPGTMTGDAAPLATAS